MDTISSANSEQYAVVEVKTKSGCVFHGDKIGALEARDDIKEIAEAASGNEFILGVDYVFNASLIEYARVIYAA